MRSGVQARAATLRDVFVQAALAVVAAAFDPSAIDEREVREVRAHGQTVEALFATWINECLYVHEVEGFAWRRIDFAVFEAESRAGAEPMRLHSFLYGEAIELDPQDPKRAIPPIPVEAVSLRANANDYELTIAI
jgi:SHS2 domain-containing protein